MVNALTGCLKQLNEKNLRKRIQNAHLQGIEFVG